VCSNPDLEAFRNEEMGFCLQVPPDAGMKDIRDPEHPNAVAQGPDETSIQVFVKDLGEKATERACWSQLMEQVATFSGERPKSVEELQAAARRGIDRGSRRVFLAPFPRDEVCLFLVVEGPQSSASLETVATDATQTFKTGSPSGEFVTKLNLQRGFRLLEDKKFADALHRFEAVLQHEPSLLPAQYGAGMAAYFAGPEYAKQAITYLSGVLASQTDAEDPEHSLQPEQHMDALMYLGLAYASAKQYRQATSTLAELVDRFPDDPTGRYNFACVLALSGDADGAMEQLQEAFSRDPKGTLKAHAVEDDDLASLRHRPDWKTLVMGESAPHVQVPAPQ
jgi:tetratricopeptide (TPR) repeat protein